MPMKERATLEAIAIKIVMVNADVKKGEKVFNAYIMLSPFVLNCCWWVGSAWLFSLCSSVVNRNEWGLASSRYACTIGTKNKSVKFFLKFFFVWCGRVGVGAWVWGAWVWGAWVWGGGIRMGRAGWRRDRDVAGWIARQDVAGESSSQGVPIPDSDCRLGCDR